MNSGVLDSNKPSLLKYKPPSFAPGTMPLSLFQEKRLSNRVLIKCLNYRRVLKLMRRHL